MSDSQQASPEQQERMQSAIKEAQERAMQEVQQNAQIEIQMRVQALGAAVTLFEGSALSAADDVAKSATIFLKFLKQGEV